MSFLLPLLDVTPSKFPFNVRLISCLQKSERAKECPVHHKHRSTNNRHKAEFLAYNCKPTCTRQTFQDGKQALVWMLYGTIKICAIKDYNHQQIVIIQRSPGGRRRLFRPWALLCSGLLLGLDISKFSPHPLTQRSVYVEDG